MIQVVDECGSTNAAIGRNAAHGDALMALTQTAGRGQRGNSWESAPGMNITLSLMVRPTGLHANRQFAISEAAALGVADLLDELGIEQVKVKWPNDVYVADKKIAGILIENTLTATGLIERSIVGIGLNVNQTAFESDAPNPVSVKQLTGAVFGIKALAERMINLILQRLDRDNHIDYRARLWRGEGEWPWVTAAGEAFTARIEDVMPDGHLVFSGWPPFAFKEVRPAGFKN